MQIVLKKLMYGEKNVDRKNLKKDHLLGTLV